MLYLWSIRGKRCALLYAMAFIYHKQESLNAYLPDTLKIDTQIAAYHEAMLTISIADLKGAIDDNADSDDKGLS